MSDNRAQSTWWCLCLYSWHCVLDLYKAQRFQFPCMGIGLTKEGAQRRVRSPREKHLQKGKMTYISSNLPWQSEKDLFLNFGKRYWSFQNDGKPFYLRNNDLLSFRSYSMSFQYLGLDAGQCRLNVHRMRSSHRLRKQDWFAATVRTRTIISSCCMTCWQIKTHSLDQWPACQVLTF